MSIPTIRNNHDPETRNIINRAIQVLNQHGITIQNLVAEGQLTEEQYASLLKSIHDMAEKREVRPSTALQPIDVDEMNTRTKQLFTGGAVAVVGENAVGRENMKPKAISPEKTTFADDGTIGGLVTGVGISGGQSTGGFISGDNRVSYIANVEPNKTYTIKIENSPLFRVATSIEYPAIDESIARYILLDDDESEWVITTEENENYIVVYVASDGTKPTYAKVQEGIKIIDDVKISMQNESVHGIKIQKETIPPDRTTFAREGLPITRVDGIRVGGGAGNWSVETNSPDRFGYIAEVEPNTRYTLRRRGGNRFRVFASEVYPDDGVTAYPLEDSSSGLSDDNDELTVTTNDRSKYIIYYLSNDANDLPTYAILQEGTEIKKGVEIDLQDNSIPLSKLKGDIQGNDRVYDKNIFLLTDNVSGNFNKTTPLAYVTDDFLGGTTMLQDAYDAWDDMLNHSPDYVSKDLLWEEPVENLPTYRYRFVPPQPIGNGRNNLQPIRILMIGNIHGHETYSTLGLANLFNDIVKHWKDNDVLSMFRWNIQFDVIPIYNPYGVQHYTRVNGNGVDLNSNMSHLWAPRDELGSMYYSGPSPMSEHENQQFEIYLDNLPYEYDFAIDMHHAGAYNGERIAYSRTLNDDVTRILFGVANQMNAFLKMEYTDIFGEDNTHDIALYPPQGTGRLFQFLEYKKIPGTLHEIAFPGDVVSQEDTVKISVNHVGNILLSAIRNINSIGIIE